jgi:hypothetical protein
MYDFNDNKADKSSSPISLNASTKISEETYWSDDNSLIFQKNSILSLYMSSENPPFSHNFMKRKLAIKRNIPLSGRRVGFDFAQNESIQIISISRFQFSGR